MTIQELMTGRIARMELQAHAFGVSMDSVHSYYIALLKAKPWLSPYEGMKETERNIIMMSPQRN